jgi:ankyrin repeat protein
MRRTSILTVAIAALLPLLAAAQDLGSLIRGGQQEEALQAIRQGVDVNALQADGSSPLLWAVYRVDHQLVAELLARGAKPDVGNMLGATPLTEAVNIADEELVRLLLKARADPNLGNQDDQTPLMLAARTGSLPIVQMLVKAGAKVDTREKSRQQTALMWAIGANSGPVTEFLIKKGADIEARALVNDWGNQITSEPRAQYRASGGLTPLLYATRGCLDCARALIKAGADVNRPTPDGVSPLMNAIDNQAYDVANLLLDHGANPHVADWWGRTALYVAVDMRSFSPRFAAGANNQAAEGAAPPLVQPALQLAQRLLELGANPNIQLNQHRPGRGGNSGRFTDDLLTTGASPLLRAAVAFDRDMVALLLKHGAVVDLPNVMGVTPLMAASGMGLSPRDTRGSYGNDAQERAIPVLQLLLDAGANVNARITDTSSHTAIIARPSSMTSRQGQTAIYGAVNWGWTRVAKFLLEHGAQVRDVKDDAGKTVLDALDGKAGGRDFRASEEMANLIRKAAGAS